MAHSRKSLVRCVVLLIALLAIPSRALAATPATQPAALARVDALLDDASRKLAAAVNPEEDCQAATTIVNDLLQRHAIDPATARQYTSQIAYLRATAGETIVAAAFKQAEADLAALQSKLTDDKPRLLDPKTEPAEARRIAADLTTATHQAAADIRALPSDDRRTADLTERMSALQQQLQAISARHTARQAIQALRQQWQQMSVQSAGWQDESLPPWAEVQRLPDPLVSLERTRALIVSSGAMLSSPAVDHARAQVGDDEDLNALLAEIRSDQQAAIAKASSAIAELLDQADRGANADQNASAMKAIAQSLRTSLRAMPDSQALADRADSLSQRSRADAPTAAPVVAAAPPAAAVAAQVQPTPAHTISAPPRPQKANPRKLPPTPVATADLSPSITTGRSNIWARLAWSLTGVLAALLAFCKSRLDETPSAVPSIARAGESAQLRAFSRVQLDPVGLILVALGAWWMVSSPDAALVPAIAMIICGLLGAIDLIGRRLSLSQGLVDVARCVAGPASAAATFIFILHLFIGGAGFI